MLMSPDCSIVLITPMKCGSTTCEDALCPLGWRYVMGPHPWQRSEIEKHTDCIPFLGQDAKKLLLIRDPFDRVLSLHNHRQTWEGPIDFDRWMQEEFPSGIHDACCAMYPNHDAVIRIEHVVGDLVKHGVAIGQPQRKNITRQRRIVLPARHHETVRQRYAKDLVYYLD